MEEIIFLDGQSLTINQVIAVAYQNTQVEISEDALIKVRRSSDFLEKSIANGAIIYAINTGFGSNASQIISDEQEISELQTKLLLSHACGVGAPFAVEMVRAIMLIRLNTLLAGFSGIKESTIVLLKDLINLQIHPIIPSQGSVGASGDLCPLSHMALALIGEGKVQMEINGKTEILLTKEALLLKNLKPIQLSYKEGIALNNGTTVMAALGVMAIAKGLNTIQLATLSSALLMEALGARKEAFDEKIHQLRRHEGQQRIAELLRNYSKNSDFLGISFQEILKNIPNAFTKAIPQNLMQDLEALKRGEPRKVFEKIQKYLPDEAETFPYLHWETLLKLAEKKINPQDAYSIRCTPQVLGASLQAIWHAESMIAQELNAVVDNPLIFTEENQILSGGNFHGQPLALVLDYLKLAFAEIGNLLERQINKLLDPSQNDLLPAFLVEKTGINSGYMIPQYTAASLVSENKVLVHPASADSIPTSANQEDHVSMGTIGGRQALEILENVRKILAIHLLTAAQGLDLRKNQFEKAGLPTNLGIKTQELYNLIRKKVPFLKEDRLLFDEINLILSEFEDFYDLLKI